MWSGLLVHKFQRKYSKRLSNNIKANKTLSENLGRSSQILLLDQRWTDEHRAARFTGLLHQDAGQVPTCMLAALKYASTISLNAF
jgi:hypothetical protein